MKRILLLEQKLDESTTAIQYAYRIAKRDGAEVLCLFLIPSSMTTADWIETQERVVGEDIKKAERIGMRIKQRFEDEGIRFSYRAIRFQPTIFMKELEASMPVDLVIAGRLTSPVEVADLGLGSIGDLGVRLNCPVIDAEAMQKSFEPISPRLWRRFILYGIGSALMYFVFFPNIKHLNKFYMGGGILAGLAIMVTVAVHAWVYGSTTECLPKFIRMDKD
nr:universal stress protein [Desulfobacterales bacterium]